MRWTPRELTHALAAWAFLLVAVIGLSGCATGTMTVQSPEGALTAPEKALANAYVTLTAQRITARQMAERGKLTPDQYAKVVATFDAVRNDLDVARGVVNLPTGQTAVATALSILLALEAQYGFKEGGR